MISSCLALGNKEATGGHAGLAVVQACPISCDPSCKWDIPRLCENQRIDAGEFQRRRNQPFAQSGSNRSAYAVGTREVEEVDIRLDQLRPSIPARYHCQYRVSGEPCFTQQ